MSADHLKDAAERAFIYTITKDAELSADAIAEIVGMGPGAVHAALSGWAGVTLSGFAEDQGTTPSGDGFWITEVKDTGTGRTVSIDEIGDPAARDAIRLVACLGNQDHATIAAIVKTAWDAGPKTLASLLVESLKLAATMAELLAARRGDAS